MAERDLSYDIFLELRKKLDENGEKFSTDKILKMTGGSGSRTTPGKHEKRYQEEKRQTLKNTANISDESWTKLQELIIQEVATQKNRLLTQLQESFSATECAFNDCLQSWAEEEQRGEKAEAENQRKDSVIAAKDAANNELAATCRAAENRADEAMREKSDALKERDAALRDAERKDILLQREIDDHARTREALRETTVELKEVREEKEQQVQKATIAETEVKARDATIAEVTTRLSEAHHKLDEITRLLIAEKEYVARLEEKAERLTDELQATKCLLPPNEQGHEKGKKQDKPQSSSLTSKGRSDHSRGIILQREVDDDEP